MRPRVILADDHVMVAEGLGRLIGEVADLVERVRDGKQLVERTLQLRPDIVVSDITMPLMSGLDALRQLKEQKSNARFIFLTVHAEARLAAQAMRAGAFGYLLKQAAGDELLDAIRAVAAGGTYLSPEIAKDVLWAMGQPAQEEELRLTGRQRQVLQLIVEGKRMKEIAAALSISVRTVEDHKAELLQTLGLKSTAQLVKFAIRQGLVRD